MTRRSPIALVVVYAARGQERLAAGGVLKGPNNLLMASLKAYQPQSYCRGLFFTQRTRNYRWAAPEWDLPRLADVELRIDSMRAI